MRLRTIIARIKILWTHTCAEIEAPQVVVVLSVGRAPEDVDPRADHDDAVSDATRGGRPIDGDARPLPRH